MPSPAFLEALRAGQLHRARREDANVGTTAQELCRPNPRRAVLVITNISANQLDLAWENPSLAASAGEYRLAAGDTYIEVHDPAAGGIGDAIWDALHAVKTTGAGNVRVVEYEVK